MKKYIYFILLNLISAATVLAQSAPENIDYGVFAPGTYDQTPPSNATFEFAIKPNIQFPLNPQAGSFLLFIKLPTASYTGNEVFTVTENNLNAAVSFIQAYDHTDNFTYFFFNYQGTSFPLNVYPINVWAHILTIHVANLGAGVTPDDFSIADASSGLYTQPIDPEFPTRTALNVLDYNELTPLSIMPALPLELVSFEAQKSGERNSHITWTTVNEVNTSRFIVQRSFDKKVWNSIGSVNAAGSSVSIENYSFLDENVYNGRDAILNVYYRLQMVDIDGQSLVSPIRSIVFGSIASTGREFAVYPNPASDGLQVAWDANALDQPTSLEFYDIQGKLVFTRKVSDNTNQEYIDLGLTNLQAGLYLLRIMNGTEPLEHRQIVVQR